MSVGDYTALSALLGRLVWPTLTLGFMLALVQRGRASWGRLTQLRGTAPELTDGTGAPLVADRTPAHARGHGADDPDRRARLLDDVSFDLAPGSGDRDRRPDRRRQEHAGRGDVPPDRRAGRRRSRSTAATSRRCRSRRCAPRSATRPRRRSCSRRRSRTTSRWATAAARRSRSRAALELERAGAAASAAIDLSARAAGDRRGDRRPGSTAISPRCPTARDDRRRARHHAVGRPAPAGRARPRARRARRACSCSTIRCRRSTPRPSG